MTASLFAAVASTGALFVSLVALLIGRRDRANEWRRDAVIPAIRRFLTAIYSADELISAYQFGVALGSDQEETRRKLSGKTTPLLVEARVARSDLELFTPDLGYLAKEIMNALVQTELDFSTRPWEEIKRGSSDIGWPIRPISLKCKELEKRARIMSRIERRSLREVLFGYRTTFDPPAA